MSLRSRVLSAFKELHRARLVVFKNDERALNAGRLKINEEFRKYMNESDPKKIEELIQVAKDSSMILRKHVVQLEQVEDDKFKANITQDTYKVDNSMYRDVTKEELAEASKKRKGKRKGRSREKNTENLEET